MEPHDYPGAKDGKHSGSRLQTLRQPQNHSGVDMRSKLVMNHSSHMHIHRLHPVAECSMKKGSCKVLPDFLFPHIE
eukprot:6192357-Pleurochrysis_carterae.AAC.2